MGGGREQNHPPPHTVLADGVIPEHANIDVFQGSINRPRNSRPRNDILHNGDKSAVHVYKLRSYVNRNKILKPACTLRCLYVNINAFTRGKLNPVLASVIRYSVDVLAVTEHKHVLKSDVPELNTTETQFDKFCTVRTDERGVV